MWSPAHLSLAVRELASTICLACALPSSVIPIRRPARNVPWLQGMPQPADAPRSSPWLLLTVLTCRLAE